MYDEQHEHQWTLSILGTGTEHCTVEGCGYSRRRRSRDGEDELRIKHSEIGVRNGAMYCAESMDELASIAEERAREYEAKAKGFREAAKHARLLAKGRDPA